MDCYDFVLVTMGFLVSIVAFYHMGYSLGVQRGKIICKLECISCIKSKKEEKEN